MEKKQTVVEWLNKQLEQYGSPSSLNVDWETLDQLIEQAKEMEKQQMIEFAKGFWYYGNGVDAPPCYNEDVEKYYNKQYER